MSEKSNQIELLLKQLQDLKLEIAQLQATNVTLENTLTNNKRQLEASNITATDAQKNVYALQKTLKLYENKKIISKKHINKRNSSSKHCSNK
ncbi:MAG: hypothetical protein HWD59_04020 [Coxiellaceae bacterium]|nr:MAG: hypothetical protein HWD59_04020 [Coxiellaceae bacterium]